MKFQSSPRIGSRRERSARAATTQASPHGALPVIALAFVSLLALVLLLTPGGAAAAEITPEAMIQEGDAFQRLDQLARWFEEHPETKEQKGSGWKPYNRALWLRERNGNDGTNSGKARWRIWEEKVRRSEKSRKTASASWFAIGPGNMSGRILDIEFDPGNTNIVYVGSASGGLWKSTDGGDTWVTSSDELPTLSIGAVCVLPTNPDIVLIGTGEGTSAGAGDDGVGILKSTDGGLTWNTTGLSFPLTAGHGFHVMEVNPLTGTILAGANDGLWRSTDDGDTWTRIQSGGNYYDVKFKPDDPTVIYTCKGASSTGNNVKVSTDDGLTWTMLGTGQPASLVGKTKIAVTPADPDVIYANYVNSSSQRTLGIYRSDDAGATWNQVYSGSNMTNQQGWYNLSLAVDPDDPSIVIAGGVSLYRSTNAGTTFVKTGEGFILGNETDVHWDHHAIAYEPGASHTVWVGNDGGVWKSTDDGVNWSSRREGISSYQFYDICVAQADPDFAMGGAQDNGIPGRSGVDDWFVSNLTADGFVCNIHPDNDLKVYAEWQFGNHVKSLDGGQTWQPTMTGITGSGAWLAPVALDNHDPKQLFTATSDGIFRSNNRANLWSNVATHTAIWIDCSLASTEAVWTVNAGRPYVSIDDGDSWTAANSYGFSVGNERKVTAHPTDPNAAFVTFGGYNSNSKIAMTLDLGVTWSDVTGDLPFQPVNTMAVDPDDPDAWYIGTDVGVWTSTNGGVNWLPYDTALPNAVVSDLEIRRNTRKLVAGTYGRGTWEVDLPLLPTGIAGAPSENIVGTSLKLMLDPPSPNPVRGKTLFRFAAKYDGPATLELYDVRGRLVDRVADVARGDGFIRTVSWSSQGVASGVYFARLRAGKETKVRRVIVVD